MSDTTTTPTTRWGDVPGEAPPAKPPDHVFKAAAARRAVLTLKEGMLFGEARYAAIAAVVADAGYPSLEALEADANRATAWYRSPLRRPDAFLLLTQGEHWWDADGRRIRIADMPAAYRVRVVQLLRARVESVEFSFGFAEIMYLPPDDGDFTVHAHDDGWHHLEEPELHEAKLAWLESTALLKALRDV